MITYQSNINHHLISKKKLVCSCLCNALFVWFPPTQVGEESPLCMHLYVQDVKLQATHSHRAAIWIILALAFLGWFAYLPSNYNDVLGSSNKHKT